MKLLPHPWKQRKNVHCSYVDGSRGSHEPSNPDTDRQVFRDFHNMCDLNSVKCELQREAGSVREKENKRKCGTVQWAGT